MSGCRLDHLVVTAPSREAGVQWVAETLGVPLQPGGEHEQMGTHNALLRLGADQYLEVVAPNPHAKPPTRPRWFALDALARDATPRLTTWVASCSDLSAAVRSSPEDMGDIEAMSRGQFSWAIAIRDDSTMVCDGMVPALIEWRSAHRPPELLEDRGVRLRALEAHSAEPERVAAALRALGLEAEITVVGQPASAAAWLAAWFETPTGQRRLPVR